jgi:quercetin dioxygenase-like cupin family protein
MEKFNLDNYITVPEKRIAKRVIYSDKNTLAFVLNIAPGESLPDHTHFDSTVLLQVISGTASLNVDEQSFDIQENDLTKIDGPETMSVDNTGNENLVLYVTISPLPPDDKYAKEADF